MKVKTLRPHDNAYGDKYQKDAGDEYDHPSPAVLIADKVVEEVAAKKVAVAKADKASA